MKKVKILVIILIILLMPRVVLAEEVNEILKEQDAIVDEAASIETMGEINEISQEQDSLAEEVLIESPKEEVNEFPHEQNALIGDLSNEMVTDELIGEKGSIVVDTSNETIVENVSNIEESKSSIKGVNGTTPTISNVIVTSNQIPLESTDKIEVGDTIEVSFDIGEDISIDLESSAYLVCIKDGKCLDVEKLSNNLNGYSFHHSYVVTEEQSAKEMEYRLYTYDEEGNSYPVIIVFEYTVEPHNTIFIRQNDYDITGNYYFNQYFHLNYFISSQTEIREVRYGLTDGVEEYSIGYGDVVVGYINGVSYGNKYEKLTIDSNTPTNQLLDIFVTVIDINGATLTKVIGQITCLGYADDLEAPIISNIVATSGTVEINTYIEVEFDVSDDSSIRDYNYIIKATDGIVYYTSYSQTSLYSEDYDSDFKITYDGHYIGKYYLNNYNVFRNRAVEYYVNICDIYGNYTGDTLITTVNVVDSSAPVDVVSFSSNKSEYYYNEIGYVEFELTGEGDNIQVNILATDSDGINQVIASTNNAIIGYNKLYFDIGQYKAVGVYDLTISISVGDYYYGPRVGTMSILGYSSDTNAPTISNIVAPTDVVYAGDVIDISFDITDESNMSSVKDRSRYVIRSIDPWDSNAPYLDAYDYISLDGKYHHVFTISSEYTQKLIDYEVELCDEYGNKNNQRIASFRVWDPTDVEGPVVTNFEASQTVVDYYQRIIFSFDAEDSVGIDTSASYIQYYLDKNTTIKDYSISYNKSTGKYEAYRYISLPVGDNFAKLYVYDTYGNLSSETPEIQIHITPATNSLYETILWGENEENHKYFYTNGEIDTTLGGNLGFLAQDTVGYQSDSPYYYVRNGEVDYSYNGFAFLDLDKLYYVTNGIGALYTADYMDAYSMNDFYLGLYGETIRTINIQSDLIGVEEFYVETNAEKIVNGNNHTIDSPYFIQIETKHPITIYDLTFLGESNIVLTKSGTLTNVKAYYFLSYSSNGTIEIINSEFVDYVTISDAEQIAIDNVKTASIDITDSSNYVIKNSTITKKNNHNNMSYSVGEGIVINCSTESYGLIKNTIISGFNIGVSLYGNNGNLVLDDVTISSSYPGISFAGSNEEDNMELIIYDVEITTPSVAISMGENSILNVTNLEKIDYNGQDYALEVMSPNQIVGNNNVFEFVKEEDELYYYNLVSDDNHIVEMVKIDGVWKYTIDGIIQTDYTGLATNNSGTWYFEDGVLDFKYTGIYTDSSGVSYYIKGSKLQKVDIMLKINGVWKYFKDGVLRNDYTGIGQNTSGTWFFENGVLDFKYTGFYTDENSVTYYFKGSKLQNIDGMMKIDGVWKYIKAGIVQDDYTGLGTNSAGTWYFENGLVDFKYTGFYTDENGVKYYIKGSKLQNIDGMMKIDGVWKYIKAGIVQDDYTGLGTNSAGTWYFENGLVDFKYTGLYTDENGVSYYIKGSKLQIVTEMVKFDGIWKYVVDGIVQDNYTGLGTNSLGTWYFENGKIRFNYNGLYTDDNNITYYLEGSKVKLVSVIKNIDDSLYYIEQGIIQKCGWVTLNGNTYYFDLTTGAAVTGEMVLDGITYVFSDDGILIEKIVPVENKGIYHNNGDYQYVQHRNNLDDIFDRQDLLNAIYTSIDLGVISGKKYDFTCLNSYACVIDFKELVKTNEIWTIQKFASPLNISRHMSYGTYEGNDYYFYIIWKNIAYSEEKQVAIIDKIIEVEEELYEENDTDIQKVRKVYEYLIEHTEYDYDLAYNHPEDYDDDGYSAYGTLINGLSVCQGYAEAMALFLNHLGISNYVIVSENHAWNVLYINGEWLHLDATWGDTAEEWDKYFLINTERLLQIDQKDAHVFDENIFKEVALSV